MELKINIETIGEDYDIDQYRDELAKVISEFFNEKIEEDTSCEKEDDFLKQVEEAVLESIKRDLDNFNKAFNTDYRIIH